MIGEGGTPGLWTAENNDQQAIHDYNLTFDWTGFDGYLRALQELGDRAGNVVFEHTLNESELAERYARASAFVCLSEHEGFCIPLLEAFAAGVPVIARPAGGVPETAGDAALLVEDRDPSVTAELIHLAAGDRELRDELARRGRERLEVYRPERAAVALRAALERLS